ncbi:MAG: M23 family metallopeptidase [Rickettsiales bacterium]|jgi:murein DD-endopeptidase MepM/ murein hydrolase activator NlpD|nr:M23 family metallopeptidase [Rickettsiales bacterium]
MRGFFSDVYRNIFSEKEVIVVSRDGIRSKKIGGIGKFGEAALAAWVIFSSCFVLLNSKIVRRQSQKISELRDINYSLNANIGDLNTVIDNMKNYLSSLNYYDHFNKIDVKKISSEKNFIKSGELLSSVEYKRALPVIDILDKNISILSDSVDSRIDGIHNILEDSPLLREKAERVYRANYGGDLINSELGSLENVFSNASILIKKNEIVDLKNKIKYLVFLEGFMNSIPITEPMRNYFLTSKYGSRVDPFSGEVRSHKGLDMAAPFNSNIFSTADGVVEFVGFNGGLGNVLVINHGNDIRTTYAHLKQSSVRKDQKVSRGKAIGVQGNSGRSTGPHLHYEVSIDKKTVDPMKFLNIGKRVYQ